MGWGVGSGCDILGSPAWTEGVVCEALWFANHLEGGEKAQQLGWGSPPPPEPEKLFQSLVSAWA